MATATRITLKELPALPETEPASEYICGALIQKPMPDNAPVMFQWFLDGGEVLPGFAVPIAEILAQLDV